MLLISYHGQFLQIIIKYLYWIKFWSGKVILFLNLEDIILEKKNLLN